MLNDTPASRGRFSETALGNRLCGSIVDAAPLAIVAVGPDGDIQFVNEESERLFGYARSEMLGRSIEMIVPQGAREEHARMRQSYLANPETRRMGMGLDLLALRKDGSAIAVEIALKPIELDGASFILAVVVDITERKRLEQQLKTAIEAAPVAMLALDPDGRIINVNLEAERLYGYGRDELIGKEVEMLVPQRLHARDPQMRDRFFRSSVAKRIGAKSQELWGLRKGGIEFPIEIGLSTIAGERGPIKLVTVLDVSERKRWEAQMLRSSEELESRVLERTADLARANAEKAALLSALQAKTDQLEQLSREDALTGILNRRTFDERLAEEVKRAQRMGSPLAVAMLDLDLFKRVNDRLGHAAGDAVLRAASTLISHQCREIDVVARYGGEEFALVLPGADLEAALTLCERIRLAFCSFDWEPIAPGLRMTVSAGASVWHSGLRATDLLAAADASLYEAKRSGRNCVRPPPSGPLPRGEAERWSGST